MPESLICITTFPRAHANQASSGSQPEVLIFVPENAGYAVNRVCFDWTEQKCAETIALFIS
ncbi:hypothetical protein D3C87_1467720 [compost metagenome]